MDFHNFYFLEKNINVEYGFQYEQYISNLFKKRGIKVPPTSRTGHGVDVLCKFDKTDVTIETKNTKKEKSDRIDFGQAKIWFDTSNKTFLVGGYSKISNDIDDEKVMNYIYNVFLEDYMNSKSQEFYNFLEKEVSAGNIKPIKGNIVKTLYIKNLKTDMKDNEGNVIVVRGGNTKKVLENILFGEKSELNIPIGKDIASKYYMKYDFIQISSGYGLYKLNTKYDKLIDKLNIPSLIDSIKKSNVRVRLKGHGGSKKEFYEFSINYSLKLDLNKSNFNLENTEQLESFINFFQNEI